MVLARNIARCNLEIMMDFQPVPFDHHHDASLLRACGYEHEFVPACWEDVGGPENGPKLDGNPDMDIWTLALPDRPHVEHVIVVIDGMVVEAEMQPTPPPGWFDERTAPC